MNYERFVTLFVAYDTYMKDSQESAEWFNNAAEEAAADAKTTATSILARQKPKIGWDFEPLPDTNACAEKLPATAE